MRSHFDPLRVLPEKCLPADSLFPGQMPAHEASWRAEGKRSMLVPISAKKAVVVWTSSRRLRVVGHRTKWGYAATEAMTSTNWHCRASFLGRKCTELKGLSASPQAVHSLLV
jgi:hypothetical protein